MCLVYVRSGWAPEGEGGAPTLTSIHRDLAPPLPRDASTPRWGRGSPAAGEVPVAGTSLLSAIIFPPARQQKKVTVPSRQGRHRGGTRPVPSSTQPMHKTGGLSSRTFDGTKSRDRPCDFGSSHFLFTEARPRLHQCPRVPLPTADVQDVALRGGGGALSLLSGVASGRARGPRLRWHPPIVSFLPDHAGQRASRERVRMHVRA